MKKAILLHGKPSKEEYYDSQYQALSNEHWFAWLQHQLLLKDILTQAPEMPTPYKPTYEMWLKTFEQFTIDIETILIGHSCGGGFLLKWLSLASQKIDKLVLVAPWIDPDNIEMDDKTFFDFEIPDDLAKKADEVHVLYSTDDAADILKTVEIIKQKVPAASFHKFENKGHFTFGDMQSREFPELLEIILGN